LIDALKRMLPHGLRQELKRRLFHVNDMSARLNNLRRAGFVCTGAVDGGAYEGEWSKTFWRSFPGVTTIMVEPLPSKSEPLTRLALSGESRYVAAALGRTRGSVELRLSETNSQVVGSTEGGDGNHITVAMTTIDDLLDASPGFRPNLLKLDLQGYELEALQGCADLAGRFEVVLLEVSLLRIGDVPVFSEVDRFLAERHFHLYDVLPQYYRPRDGALWQCDAFYVRSDSSLIASRDWA
jgi:FkbM family methyltransferase